MSTRDIPIDDPEPKNESNKATGDLEIIEGGAHNQEELPSAEASPLEERIIELEQERDRLRDQALRAVADLENVRRRAAAERQQVIIYANERLLRDLLPIVDDIHRSVESGSQTRDFDAFFQGVSMINEKIRRILEGQGVTRIETLGREFDVNVHEALMRQPSDAPEDSVISELEPGYMYNDRVLRHAKVIVSAGAE